MLDAEFGTLKLSPILTSRINFCVPKKSIARRVRELETLIYQIRGRRVMLESYLARIYEVTTKAFNQAVKRNVDKFPADFMFRRTAKEAGSLRHSRSQVVTLKRDQNIKYLPYVFAEHGALQAADVLRSRALCKSQFYNESWTPSTLRPCQLRRPSRELVLIPEIWKAASILHRFSIHYSHFLFLLLVPFSLFHAFSL
jgi:hypothetical protein